MWPILAIGVGAFVGRRTAKGGAIAGGLASMSALLAALITHAIVHRLFGASLLWASAALWLVQSMALGLPLGVVGACTVSGLSTKGANDAEN